MAEAHATHTFYRGDDWLIAGKAHNADWSPLVLSSPDEIEWQLKNVSGAKVLDLESVGVTLTITDGPTGQFKIVVSRDVTAALAAGTYNDQCRITTDAVRSTQWYGVIENKVSFFEA